MEERRYEKGIVMDSTGTKDEVIQELRDYKRLGYMKSASNSPGK